MRPAAVLLAWSCSLWLLWVCVPRAAVAPLREPATGTSHLPPRPSHVPVRPPRDLFRYASRPSALAPRVAPAPAFVPQVLPSPVPTPEPVRVLGIVRQGDRLRAMLSLRGETGLVAVGERFAGYEVVALDEETVRLRSGADELTIVLPP